MKIESLINYTDIVKLLEQSEEVSEIMSYQIYEVHVGRNKQPDFIKNTAAETVVHFRSQAEADPLPCRLASGKKL